MGEIDPPGEKVMEACGRSGNSHGAIVRCARSARGDEKKLVIAGLSDLNHADGLALVSGELDNPDVSAEAASAAVKLARDIKAPNDAAKAVMVKVAAIAKDEKVKRDAEKMVEKFGK